MAGKQCGEELREGYEVVASRRTQEGWRPRALPEAIATLFPELFETDSQIKKACRRKFVFVNSKAANCSTEVGSCSDVVILSRVTNRDLSGGIVNGSTQPNIEVIFQDDHLAVVVKPQGISTVGKGGNVTNLLSLVLEPTRASVELSKGALHSPKPVHRLDRLTGGLLAVAKTSAAMTKLASSFANREVEKKYVALVHGLIGEEEGKFDTPVDGKEAFTIYKRQRFWEVGGGQYISEVSLSPKTGESTLRHHCRCS